MAIKKSQLYASLWQSCDELRGGMDASQYKDYILTLLFMKYVSDKAANSPWVQIVVPEGGGFADIATLKGDTEIGDKINKIIGKLAEENDLKGVIDQADFNDDSKLGRGREMQDRLSKLVAIFEGLDLRMNHAEGDDLLGDAYEYLMQHFATESGKSKGQFYTPAEVSRIMAKIIGIGPETRQDETIYDPACGSGSLLLRAADAAPRGLSIYGQEKDNATYALARMNMILHDYATAELWHGNTLSDPYFKDSDTNVKTFDFAVANPPFSDKAWTSGLDPAHDVYGRFVYGVPPAKNGDYAFLLHFIASLKSRGKGAIILPHGVLFRGNREADIRTELIRRRYIKGIIGLPANLFYGTGIPACILVIDKENAHARNGIFMIDASKGFSKDGNKNRLRPQDIHKIVSVFNEQKEVPRYARMVPLSEIADPANDYNLNIPRYIDSSALEDVHDLGAHIKGGVPHRDIEALSNYWTVFPGLRDALFAPNGSPGYSAPLVETQHLKTVILTHREFLTYQQRVDAVFQAWREAHEPLLRSIEMGTSPKKTVQTLSEDLLNRFDNLPLLDPYDVYQKFMDYWVEVMQDDVYLLAAEGWVNAAKPRGILDGQQQKIKETPDLVVKRKRYKTDLVPPSLVIGRYFAAEQKAMETLQTKQTAIENELIEFVEAHTGEEGLLADAVNDSGNVTATGVKQRLKALAPDLTAPQQMHVHKDEQDALEHCLSLLEAKSKTDKAIKAAELQLEAQALAHYATFTENEIKTLVVQDKWIATIQAAITGEVHRLTQVLTERLKQLEERYVHRLPDLVQQTDTLSEKVESHLQKMGVIKKKDSQSSERFSGEWETKSVSKFGDIVTGGTPNTKNKIFWDGPYPWITPTDITSDRDMTTSERMITEEGLGSIRTLPPNTVLVTCIASIGKNAILRETGACNQQINAVIPSSDHTPEFLYYLFEYNSKFLLAKAGVTATPIISKSIFGEFVFQVPSLDEQSAIAEVLSDVDALLTALEALIAKKRDIKKATMQQLLTGKTRLPGFNRPWETKRLGEVTEIRKGTSITEKNVVSGTIPVIAGGQKPAYFHNIANRTGKTITVSASGAYAGYVALYNQSIFASDCSTISEHSSFSIDFLYYFLVFKQNVIYNSQAGGAQPHIYPTDLLPLQVHLPPLREQYTIAEVLSDMDAEIAALEKRLAKTRGIKQGMMQELLTGRVRLS